MSAVLSRKIYRKWRPTEFRPLGHFHRPKVYRYRVADPKRFRPGLNCYPYSVIGCGVVIGRWNYCIKWARPADYRPLRRGQGRAW